MQPQQNPQSMQSHHLQQMQMHQQLQAAQMHQHSAMGGHHNGSNMGPGLANNPGQAMLSSSRHMGNLHQNFPQMVPHQMPPFPGGMPNQQVQQPQNMVQQAQMGSHQQNHAKAAQQQLLWNAMAASNNRNTKVSGGAGGFNSGNSPASNIANPQSLNVDPQLMQQRSNQPFPNMPSGMVASRMPMSTNSVNPSMEGGPNMQNSSNKKMTNEQMLLLQQQKIIADLQSQIQQIQKTGGNNGRPQSAQMHQGMNNNDMSFNDMSSQQGQGDGFPMFAGGMNPSQGEKRNSITQQHLAMPNNLPNMMNMPNNSSSNMMRDMNNSSDFNGDPLGKSQPFMNPLGGANGMGQAPGVMMQNQMFPNNMKQQQRRSVNAGDMMNLQGIYNQQQNMGMFNKRNSFQAHPQQMKQRAPSSGGKTADSNDNSNNSLASSLGGDDLFRHLPMGNDGKKGNRSGTDIDDKKSDASSSRSRKGLKRNKSQSGSIGGNLDQLGKRRGGDSSSKGSKGSQGKNKNKRKLEDELDNKDSLESDPKKLNRSGEKSAFVGGWQSNDDIPDRRRMIVCVVKVIEQMRPDASKISHKFPLMAKKLEEHLYRSAASKEEYSNVLTLKKRLQMIAHALGIQKNPEQEAEAPFNDKMFSSTDDIDPLNFETGLHDKGDLSQADKLVGIDGIEGAFADELKSDDLLKKTQDSIFNDPLLPELQQSGGSLDLLGDDLSDVKSNKQNSLPLPMQDSRNAMKKQRHGIDKPDPLVSGQAPPGPLDMFNENGNTKAMNSNEGFPMMNSSSGVMPHSNMQQLPPSNQPGVNFPNLINGNSRSSFNQNQFDMGQGQAQNQLLNTQMHPNICPPADSLASQIAGDSSVQRKKQIRLQQQRLLLLRHASKCTLGAACKTQYCAEMVKLWKHIKKCTDRYCSTPHCLSSRCVLNHYRICKRERKSATCEVCAPVIKKTRTKEDFDPDGEEVDQIEQLAKEQESNRLNTIEPLTKGKLPEIPASGNNNGTGNNMIHNMMMNQQNGVPNLPPHGQVPMTPQTNDQFLPSQTNANVNQMAKGQQEQKLQQQQLLLQQLNQQQADLLKQRKQIQQQQQLAQPNSAKGEHLRNQLNILFQLQQQISHQQRILQNVVQEQQIALQASNPRSRNDTNGSSMQHSAHDAASVGSFKSVTTEKTRNSTKRKSKDNDSSSEGKSKGKKGKRVNGKNKNQKKDSGKDSKSLQLDKMTGPKTKDILNGVLQNTDTLTKTEIAKNKKDDPENKIHPSLASGIPVKVLRKRPEQSQNASLISSMSTEDVEDHLSSLSEPNLTPRTIAQKCLPIVEKLMNDKFGWVFRDPVDPLELGIPDYFNVVKQPMDLSLVKKKLEDGMYEDLETFSRETTLIFENAILYNGEKSDVGDMANSMINMFNKEIKPIMKSRRADGVSSRKKVACCLLCSQDRLQLEGTVLYCNGFCGMQRIRRNATYYTDVSKQNHWCGQCYVKLNDSDPILLDDGNSITKTALQKTKNDALAEEAWVQCDDCSGWVHQICALFNGRENRNAAKYTCPRCHLKHAKERKDKFVAPFKTAKDLQSCSLSKALEADLQGSLQKQYEKTALELGRSLSSIEKASGLHIRVVSNVKKKHAVRDEMYKRYAKRGCPSEYPVTSKCILLFQTIQGVDVLLFAMYVFEYGDKCPPPNRRRAYISYLDSVQYFQPKRYRTYAYHSILIGYLRQAKNLGFHTAHIWSCPPSKGDEYVFFCRPNQQCTPNDEMLCSWYRKLLERAKEEGVVLKVTTLYDEYFKEKAYSSGAFEPPCLPYFEGDYIPGEIENIIKDLNSVKEAKRKDSKMSDSSKGSSETPVGKKVGTRSNPGELINIGQDKVMLKLGQSLKNMKQNFLVVHLLSREFESAVQNGDDVKDWTKEKAEGICIKSTSSAINENLQKSYLVGDAENRDITREDESFDTRQQFLNYCQGNHFQFDQLRRAKHTSMMILYHLHNPAAPKILQQCGACYREITHGIRYHCQKCSNFDLCQDCYKPIISGAWAQRDPRFAHDKTHSFKRINMDDKSNPQFHSEERAKNLDEHLKLLVHATTCTIIGKSKCTVPRCHQMKQLLHHLRTCTIAQKNTCTVCTRVLSLLSMHAKQCNIRGRCNVLFCDRIRERNKRLLHQQQLMDDRRREAQNQLHRTQNHKEISIVEV